MDGHCLSNYRVDIREPLFTFQILQVFGFGPSGLLRLRVVIVRLPYVRLVLLPGAFRQHLLKDDKTEETYLRYVTKHRDN